MVCPEACKKDRSRFEKAISELYGRSLSPLLIKVLSWGLGLLVFGVLTLFGLYGGFWAHASTEYATKDELRELKTEQADRDKRTARMLEKILNAVQQNRSKPSP